ncbi:MAG: ABC transporter substrate-binding protein [Anaerostipes sp.]|uniref:ABC transporter substrate-binding protein n=1 Tax=Anaerostipes sp. 992a TaxID=1261637 RepID=UPI000952F763|nr:ABC transporter substrate-binding protein [Anaerostipes sp. 992a]MCI5952297.1 ABC transporter substrate-binding protein [Anaerostipes sp.]OLR62488.1 ABC transporter substrate-binding protein [Anaerostipes sp. 992a]
MKKLVSVLLIAVMVLSLGLTGCGKKDKEKPVLKIFNAGEYIDKSLLTEFEKAYNCRIIYETFDSNESMYTKIRTGETYDILVPSDYMIERLIKEDYLAKIDWNQISNKENLNPDVMGQKFDPDNEYSVPYFYGTVGILYNKKVVDKADLADGWNLLRNKKYKGDIYMYDSERDSFMVALKALGYSMNTSNKTKIQKAYRWLVKQRDTMDVVYVTDDVIDNMISGNKSIAVVYSGDGALIMSENEDMDFFEPEEGTNMWTDCMVITKSCKNTELAHEFINFMCDVDNAYLNSQEVGYSSAVQPAFEMMRDNDFKGIDAFIPRTGHDKDQVFRYQKNTLRKYYSELWTKVKAY